MKKGYKSESISLRQRAEELLKMNPSKSGSHQSGSDTMKLIHELEVHQIELEMQNEELLLARSVAMEEAEKYTELYDFAPSGYLTLSKKYEIVNLNLSASQLLGKERSKLKNCRFDIFISDDTKPFFSLFFEKVFESKIKETCEVALTSDGKLLTYVILSGIIDKNPEYCLITAIDITEQTKAEKEVLKIGKHYLAMIEKAPDGIALIDSEGKFKFVSLSSRRIFGYNDTEEITDDPAKYTHPDDLHLVLAELDKLIKEPSYVPTLQYRFARKDGNFRWIESTFSNLLADPDVESIVINFHDITDRKQTEEDLKESISLYKLLSENVRDVVWLMDFDLRTTYISPSVERLRGYTLEELDNMSLEQHLTPESVEVAMTVFREEMAKLKANPNHSLDLTFPIEFYCKDGSTVWLENTFTIIRDENGLPVSILGEGRDITERRNSQETLVKLQLAIDASSEVVFITDNQGVFTFINPAFTAVYGYTPNEVIGKVTPRILKSGTLDDEFYKLFWKNIVNGKEVKGEWINKTKDGRVINIEGSSTPIIVDEKKIIGFLGVQRDITERKHAEEELKKNMEEMQRFHRLTVGRELTMIEIKKEVNELLRKSGEPEKYRIVV